MDSKVIEQINIAFGPFIGGDALTGDSGFHVSAQASRSVFNNLMDSVGKTWIQQSSIHNKIKMSNFPGVMQRKESKSKGKRNAAVDRNVNQEPPPSQTHTLRWPRGHSLHSVF